MLLHLVKEKGLQPEDAERQAYNNSISNCFVPQVEKTECECISGLYPWEENT